MKKTVSNDGFVEYYDFGVIEINELNKITYTPVSPFEYCERLKGLQDYIGGFRSHLEYKRFHDPHYQSVYEYEADKPIIYEWMELIPEERFIEEIVLPYIKYRNSHHGLHSDISSKVDSTILSELRSCLETFFIYVEELKTSRWTFNKELKA